MKAMVIDDNQDICRFLKAHLPESGFEVEVVHTGQDGINALTLSECDILILDLNLPDMTGEDVINHLREAGRSLPVIVFTVVSDTQSKVRLLNSGADDYMVKPFSFEELTARMRALLRRPSDLLPNTLSVSNVVLDARKQTVERFNESITLTRKEFAILEYLMRNAGSVVQKGTLIENVWHSSSNPFSDTLDTHMANLRKKLGAPELIHTIHGRGYRI